jgi:hypothetical protein
MGKVTVVAGEVTSLDNTGTLFQDIAVGEAQVTKMSAEEDLLDSKLNESYATIHKIVADSVINYGSWSYSLSSGGVSAATRTKPVTPLADVQLVIAKEQAKGYTYNAWSNAVTASAGMVGTAMAASVAEEDLQPVILEFRNILDTLITNVELPIFPATT